MPFFAKENLLSLGWLVGIHWTLASIPHPWSYNRSQVLKDNCNKILMGSCDLRSTHKALKATKTESRGMISVTCWTFWLLLNIRLSRINVIVQFHWPWSLIFPIGAVEVHSFSFTSFSSLSIFVISPIIFSRDPFEVSDDRITLKLLVWVRVTLFIKGKLN